MTQNTKNWNPRKPMAVGFLSIGLMLGTTTLWAVNAQISGAVIASGAVQLESNQQVVQHAHGGVVGQILARNGDVVGAGDVLVRLDETFVASDLESISAQLAEVEVRKARLAAERDGLIEFRFGQQGSKTSPSAQLVQGEQTLFQTRLKNYRGELKQLDEQINQAHVQITGLTAQLQALEAQVLLVSEDLKAGEELRSKGLIASSRISALKREYVQLKGQIGSLNASKAQLRGQISAFEIEAMRLTTKRREEAIVTLRELEYMEIDLQARKRGIEKKLENLEIKSPVAGVVHGSQVFTEQAVISPAQAIMQIVPQDQQLVVKSRIQTMHVDDVYLGQNASIRFVSFDHRTTPELFGYVSKISPDVFFDEVTGLSYYQAEITPHAQEIDKLGAQKLMPGMPVEAFIKTAERSPLSYLTKPLMDYFYRAFREV
ncbi:HlyD family type I secretion periplasmic adaptor subunit [Cognatishimia sp.]|uniref:HlyD family type I secretion periplasmic adaptor subunit n=1 Tax=Cognatishimia sp. TaxID=2211648 RepID=UPI0035188BC8|nr:HlyD family type I secretion periplasmic adaptor subunit [Cognatishimia sp.]